MTGGVGSGKLVRHVPVNVPGVFEIVAESGSLSRKVARVIVYKAEVVIMADTGGGSWPHLGHSWWDLRLQPEAAEDLLPNSLYDVQGLGGYWQRSGIVQGFGPGEVRFGMAAVGNHAVTGGYQWSISLGEYWNSLTYVLDKKENPGSYSATSHNCTTVAIEVGSVSQGGWGEFYQPHERDAFLNGLPLPPPCY
jgi:hypothetical protein